MVQDSTKEATMRVAAEEDSIRVGVEVMGQTVGASVKAPGEDSTKTVVLVMVQQMLAVLTR